MRFRILLLLFTVSCHPVVEHSHNELNAKKFQIKREPKGNIIMRKNLDAKHKNAVKKNQEFEVYNKNSKN